MSNLENDGETSGGDDDDAMTLLRQPSHSELRSTGLPREAPEEVAATLRPPGGDEPAPDQRWKRSLKRALRPSPAAYAVAFGGVIAIAVVWYVVGRAAEGAPTPPSPAGITLQVRTVPSTAEVSVDGTKVPAGERRIDAPCKEGKRTLVVSAAGHANATRELPCTGRVIMDVVLKPEAPR